MDRTGRHRRPGSRRKGNEFTGVFRLPALTVLAAGLVWAPGAEGHQRVPGEGRALLTTVVRTALERNRDVLDAEFQLAVAREQVSEAWSNVYPSVDLSSSFTRNVAPQVSFLPAQIFDPAAAEGEFIPVQFGADNIWSLSVNAEQTLVDPRAFVGLGAAARFQNLQREALRGRTQQVVTRVRLGFYDLLLAQEEVRLTENSLRRVRQSLKETRAMHEAGLAAAYDVLRLEVEVANLEPNLGRAVNRRAAARRTLAIELGTDPEAGLEVAGSLAQIDLVDIDANSSANRDILSFTGVPVEEGADVASAVRRGTAQRSDIRQLEMTEQLRKTELRLEQVEYLPKVLAFGTYGLAAQQNGPPDFFGTKAQRGSSKQVGLRVTFPLFSGFGRDARIDQRHAALRQAEVQTRFAADQAEVQLRNFMDEAREARARAGGQLLAVSQAQRGYEIASAQYREGLGEPAGAYGRRGRTEAERIQLRAGGVRLPCNQGSSRRGSRAGAARGHGHARGRWGSRTMMADNAAIRRRGRGSGACGLLAATGVLIAVAACGGAQGEGSAQDQAENASYARVVNVEVDAVEPRAFNRIIRVTGVARAMRDVVVSAQEQGVVRRIVRDKGQPIRMGQAILRLDDAILRAQVRTAAAQAGLADELWERRKKLYEEDGIGSEVSYLEAKYVAEQNRGSLAALQERLARTTITAPISGTLDARIVELGSMVSPGTPVARIVQTDSVKILAGVPERYALDLSVGASVSVVFDVVADEILGASITYVGAAVDPDSRTFPVELTLPNPGRRIKPEMVASIAIVQEELSGAIVVPRQALVAMEEGHVVFVVEGRGEEAVAVARRVRISASQGNEAVIDEGLEAGDRVVVVGQQGLTAGDRVRIVPGGAGGEG